MAELTPEQKAQLDRNIRAMLEGGATEADVIAYTNDFKNKYEASVKKKVGGAVSSQPGVATPEFTSDPQSLLGKIGQPSPAQPQPELVEQGVSPLSVDTRGGLSTGVSRNPYAGVFDISSKLGLGQDATTNLYNRASNGDVQPLVDIVKKLDADLAFRKEAKKNEVVDKAEANTNELSGFTIYPDDIKTDETFRGEEELVNSVRKNTANLIDAALADRLNKSDNPFFSAKQLGDERRRLRSEIGEEVGYKDEVGDIEAVKSLKNKFAFGIDIPTKEKQTQQAHDFLNEKGIYESALKTLDAELQSLEQTPQVRQYLDLVDKANKVTSDGVTGSEEHAEAEKLLTEIDNLRSDPTVNEYVRKISKGQGFANRLEQLPRSYPAVLVEQRRQQIANAWADRILGEDQLADAVPGHQTARQLRKIFVGDKPSSDEDYEALSKELNIPVEDVKMLSEAPGSNIGVPSRLGRIWNSAQGVIGSSVQGVNRMVYDTNEANVINKQLDKTRYKPAQAIQDRDWSVDKVIDTMADGLGQFAGYVVGAEVLGLPLRAAAAGAEGLGAATQIGRTAATSTPAIIRGIEKAKSIGGTFATGYVSSFEDAYQYAATQTDDESKRQEYAKSVAVANGLSELILRDVDVAGKILKGRNPEEVLSRFLNKETPFTTGDVLKARMGEFAKTIGYESLEELIPFFTEVFQKDNVFGNKMSASEVYNGALETIVQTAISTVPMGAFSSLSVPTQRVMESALLEAAKTPERFNQKWEELYNKGTISEQEMNSKIKVVNTVADIYKKIPNEINGEPVSEEQKGQLINVILGKRQLKAQKENVDESLHGPIDQQIKDADKKIDDVINKKPTDNTQAQVPGVQAKTQETTTTTEEKDIANIALKIGRGQPLDSYEKEFYENNKDVVDKELGRLKEQAANTDTINVGGSISEVVPFEKGSSKAITPEMLEELSSGNPQKIRELTDLIGSQLDDAEGVSGRNKEKFGKIVDEISDKYYSTLPEYGRVSMYDIHDPLTDKVIVPKGKIIDANDIRALMKAGIEQVGVEKQQQSPQEQPKAKDFEKAYADEIVDGIDKLSLPEQVRLDMNLHDRYNETSKNKRNVEILKADSEKKKIILDIFEGKNTNPSDIDNSIKLLKEAQETHRFWATRGGRFGGKKWNNKWVEIYDGWIKELESKKSQTQEQPKGEVSSEKSKPSEQKTEPQGGEQTLVTGEKFSWDNLDNQPTNILQQKLDEVDIDINFEKDEAALGRLRSQKSALERTLTERGEPFKQAAEKVQASKEFVDKVRTALEKPVSGSEAQRLMNEEHKKQPDEELAAYAVQQAIQAPFSALNDVFGGDGELAIEAISLNSTEAINDAIERYDKKIAEAPDDMTPDDLDQLVNEVQENIHLLEQGLDRQRQTEVKQEPKLPAGPATVKMHERPPLENPVYKVTFPDGSERFIQRAEGMNPGDTAWYEVAKDDKGSWYDVNQSKTDAPWTSPLMSNIGYTKKEAIANLQSEYDARVEVQTVNGDPVYPAQTATETQPQIQEAATSVIPPTPAVEVQQEENSIEDFADRIISGERLDKPTDMEFYQNNAEAIEAELKRRFAESAGKAVPSEYTPEERKKVSDSLFDLADRIEGIDVTGSGGPAALSNLLKVPPKILAGLVRTVAKAVQSGENLVDAIKKVIAEYNAGKDKNDPHIDERDFEGYIKSVLAGGKPKAGSVFAKHVNLDVEGIVPGDQAYLDALNNPEPRDPIAAYNMTRQAEVSQAFGSGLKQQELFNSLPSDERFRAQMDMLQDGKSLIAAAQSMFGSTDVLVYGPQLFQYIQNMPANDVGLTNKRAVLLATFLGEIKQAIYTNENPSNADALRQLDNRVASYYNRFMHVTAKNLAAARLLRLFRDKYMAGMFTETILEKDQVDDLHSTNEAEASDVSDEDAVQHEDKKKQKADEKKAKAARTEKKKKESKRKNGSKDDYARKSKEKEEDIKNKYGSKDNLVNNIIDRIKKINCK